MTELTRRERSVQNKLIGLAILMFFAALLFGGITNNLIVFIVLVAIAFLITPLVGSPKRVVSFIDYLAQPAPKAEETAHLEKRGLVRFLPHLWPSVVLLFFGLTFYFLHRSWGKFFITTGIWPDVTGMKLITIGMLMLLLFGPLQFAYLCLIGRLRRSK